MKILKENKYFIFDRPIKINLKYHIKQIRCRIHYLVASFGYRTITKFLLPKDKSNKKYTVSICAIFRDEGEILKEWIEFHRIVGVQHFYLYNNFSADNYKQILDPYIRDGIVTLTDWPYERQQMAAYKHCADNYREESKWIGFIDLDEFVVPNGQNHRIYDFLQSFENRTPFVVIYWRFFGSSGLINRDRSKLVTESFTSCWYKYVDIGKYFWNTRFSYYANEKRQGGYMHYRWGSIKGVSVPSMNEFGEYIMFGIHRRGATSEFPIQINHYVIKSFYEYCEKKAKRGGGVHAIQDGFHDIKYFFYHEQYCQSMDYRIMRYMGQLKLKLYYDNDVRGKNIDSDIIVVDGGGKLIYFIYVASRVSREAA